jgi:site-specific DNA recombinase
VSRRTIKPGLRPATAIRCVGYLRLSDLRDEDLTEDGDVKSFEARETALRNFAAGLGWPVIEVIRENDFVRSKNGKRRGASAFKKKRVILPDGTAVMRVVRPGFEKVLDYLRSGRANALIGEHLDRLMREPIDNERLIEIVEAGKINARSLSGSLTFTDGGTDHEITTARIMVAIANQASRDTRRRVAAGRKRKADRREWGGGPRPFGFEPDGVTIRPDEAEIIRVASERVLVIDGHTNKITSLKTLARELREAEVPTCTGAQWTAETLRDILARPRNAGILVHDGEEIGAAPWRAIVPLHVFRRVVALLMDPSRNTSPGAAPKWLGSGSFLCGACNDGTTVEVTMGNLKKKQPDDNGNETLVTVGKREPRFRCREKNHLTRNVANVLDLVERATIARLSQPDAVDLLPPVADTSAVDLDALTTEAKGIRERLNDMAADYALGRGQLDKQQFTVASKAARDRLAEIDEQVKSTAVSPLLPLIGAEDVAAEWHARTFGEQQAILNALWVVTILPQGFGGRAFKPELIDIRERSTLPPQDADVIAA